MVAKATAKAKVVAKPFITLKTASNVIKFISVFEISKIIINKERLEITVLLTSGDKEERRKGKNLKKCFN